MAMACNREAASGLCRPSSRPFRSNTKISPQAVMQNRVLPTGSITLPSPLRTAFTTVRQALRAQMLELRATIRQ